MVIVSKFLTVNLIYFIDLLMSSMAINV